MTIVESSERHAHELTENERTAIKLFELAEEREVQGQLSDSVKYYRQATKLCHNVETIYRQKHLPGLVKKLQQERGHSRKVDEDQVKRINVDKLLQSFEYAEVIPFDPNNPDHLEPGSMVIKLGITDTEVPQISPLLDLHDDIWVNILEILISTDCQSWFNFSMTCKRNAYIGFGNQYIWKYLWNRIYPSQIYDGLTMEMKVQMLEAKLNLQYGSKPKQMLKTQPYIRFGGIYISVVNYLSEGGKLYDSSSWINPTRTITYYRYFRFYPDGQCLMLLTFLEPKQIVPFIQRGKQYATPTTDSNSTGGGGGLDEYKSEPSRIYCGSWTLDDSTSKLTIVVTNGPSPHHVYYYTFVIKNMAHYYHGKLNWEAMESVRKPVVGEVPSREGEVSQLSIRKEKPFRFLKVKSYQY
ncbi:uncharacterized protein KQ657_004527 [Scheffersomyces spartinae]|uniref:F-box protein Hrt3/FBXO9 C-terminal domain-containing protein n=1 Tax=Scheffersomyces spartinae TaxID=45513 RepID=A0A9P7VAP9_9ASCO|nr:uncharacterized protein KQ657_004527 [Scheffersomyces spartinae]KAG7194315.1 hypothetical protein KQ657_004527 [Scheffersomyces spartinae]